MEIHGGVTQSAVQEAALQQYLTSGEAKKKRKSRKDSSSPPQALNQDEVNVNERLALQEQESVQRARSALNSLSATRVQKIESVHQRIENGFYEDREVLEAVAEKLLLMFGKDARWKA